MRRKVFGLEYEVRYRDQVGTWGEVEFKKQIIWLPMDCLDGPRDLTEWHELVHCIEFAYGWDLGEPMVDQLATAIHAILRDNEL